MGRLQETLDIDLSRLMSMSKNELTYAVRRLSMESNKRLAQFKKRGITSPATVYVEKHGGKFTSKNKDIYQLRAEFQRAKEFLGTETGTITGYRAWESKVANTLRKNTGIDYDSLTELQKRKFWKAYAQLEELDQANVYSGNYRSSVNAIYNAVKRNLSYAKLDKFIVDLDKNIYKESAKDFSFNSI